MSIFSLLLIFFALFIKYYRVDIYGALLFSFLIESTITFGLYKQKTWIPMILTFFSSFTIISLFLINTTGVHSVIKLLSIFWASLHIYFFSRQEVREYFKAKKALTLF